MEPGTATILDCWERLDGCGPLDRAVGLLGAFRAAPPDEIEDWPVGRRDAATLAVRARLFGETIRATVPCPACATVAELAFAAGDVAAADAIERVVEIAGEVRPLRPVSTRDLRAALASDQPRLTLARACTGGPVAEADLPLIAQALQRADPQADIRLNLRCDACETRWCAPFDVPRFVWAELGAWARRRLAEVHRLASTYGWSERDILALSPARRDRYLAMCVE